MKKTWAIIAMLAAFSCACEEDSEDSCVNGTRICNASGVRAECVDGDFVEIPCSAGSSCDNGACKQLTDNCPNDSQAYSIDGVSISYCVNGRVVTEPCPEGYTVGVGSKGSYCVPPINPVVVDSNACNSNGAQRCSASGVHQVCNGSVWVEQPCTTNKDEAGAWKCESGECVHYTVCYEGLLSCDGTTVLKCAKGAKENLWKKDVDCAADGKVCKAGKCVAASSSSSERYQDCDAFGCQVEGGKACSAICQEEEGTSKCYVDTEEMMFGCGDIPSGNQDKLTCDEFEAQYGPCELKSGGTCEDYCKSQGSNECYVDLNEGMIDCGDSAPAPSEDYMTCDEIDELFASEGGCVLTDNTKCQDACKAEGSDVCYISMSDGALICEDPNGGSTNPPSGESCDLFDCSSTKFDNGQTGKQICAGEGEFSVPLCDDEGLYCLKRESGSDSTCSDGEAYTYQKKDGGTGTDCFVIGSDASCLGGSSGGDDYSLCGSDCILEENKTSCIDYCKSENSASTCLLDSEGYIECSDSCKAADAGKTKPYCLTIDSGSYLLNQVCTAVGSNYYYITDYSKYDQCKNGCNAAGTACK